MIDVNLVEILPAVAGQITVKATFDYGTALNPILLQGVTGLTDWSFFDVTNQVAFGNPSAVSEVTQGNYTLVDAFVSGDDYTVSVVKDGFIGSLTFTAA